MAFPSMVVASGITGSLLYLLAPGGWDFWVCWLIGVISAATDPVAVVALLKELGASKSLGTLIEGEVSRPSTTPLPQPLSPLPVPRS